MQAFFKEWMEVLIFIPLGTVWVWMFKKNIDTYTKEETVAQIELRTTPMKELLDNNTKAIEDLAVETKVSHTKMNDTLTNISIAIASLIAVDKDRNRRATDEDTDI